MALTKVHGSIWDPDTNGQPFSVKDFGTVGDGVATEQAAFAAAELGADLLIIPAGTYVFSVNTVLTKDYVFLTGAILKPTGSSTLTLNGSVHAQRSQIFDDSAGTILGNPSVRGVYPEWWGAVPSKGPSGYSAGATDYTSEIQSCINFCEQKPGGEMLLDDGYYRCDTGLVVNRPVSILGTGTVPNQPLNFERVSMLDFSNAADAVIGLTITHDTASTKINGLILENFMVYRNTMPSTGTAQGILLQGVHGFRMDDIHVNNFQIPIDIDDNGTVISFEGSCRRVRVWNAATEHLRVAGAADIRFTDAVFGGDASAPTYIVLLEVSANANAPNAISFDGCKFIHLGTQPTNIVRSTAGFWNTFRNCVFEEASSTAIRTQYVSDLSVDRIAMIIDNCWFNNTDGALLVNSKVAPVYVTNSRLEGPSNAIASVLQVNLDTNRECGCNFSNNRIRFATTQAILINSGSIGVIHGNQMTDIDAGDGFGVTLSANSTDWVVTNNLTNTSAGTDGTSDAGTTNTRDNNKKF